MSELGDDMKALRAHLKQERERTTAPCEGCVKFHPKRQPTKLREGQRCRWCGWTRPKVTK